MCHSGECSWEDGHIGQCNLLDITKEKFNLFCEFPCCKEHEEFLKSEEYQKRLKEAHEWQTKYMCRSLDELMDELKKDQGIFLRLRDCLKG